jgi:hypothetical protein
MAPKPDRIEPMSRPLVPSVILTALALAGHVRPRFMEDWPQLSEANLIARTRKTIGRRSPKGCSCDQDFEGRV